MKVAIIGECMLELSHRSGSSFDNTLDTALSFGGDTLNTAIYLARLGANVDYVTALGDDAMSSWMLSQWRAEGVGCDLVETCVGAVPGMYMIRTDAQGERSFLYWRDNSPASQLFDDEEKSSALFHKLMSYDYIYLSGITLGIYKLEAVKRLLVFLSDYREQGGKVIFDGNYRPKLWSSVSVARDIYHRIGFLTDIALPTHDDECMLFDEQTTKETLQRFSEYKISELTMKMGGLGALVVAGAEPALVKATEVNVVDTTAAGDSFNAAYLAARLKGLDAERAALSGHALASTVIQHRGAVIDKEYMPKNLFGL